jgi:hypothetical protein
MREKPKLQCTRNYSLFEMHECNRPLHNDPALLASMSKVGFMPSSPIQCVRNGHGTLKVLRGHHRLDIAKRLALPVWYVVDDSKVDIFDVEGGRQQWSALDFTKARAMAGEADCQAVLEFQQQYGLTLGVAASLLGGQSAGSGNMVRAIKDGSFRVTANPSHAHAVGAIVVHCRARGVSFAARAAFAAALSMCLRVPEFDTERFLHCIELNGAILRRRTTKEEYLDEIDALYNYGAKAKRLSLAFKAKELSRQRQRKGLARKAMAS